MSSRMLVLLSALVLAATAARPMTADVRGSGPVVVMQSGLGDGAAVWRQVQGGVADFATAVAHDRPGYGRNPPVDGDRSPCTLADEERALLRSLNLPPPYVLVGHSLGGLVQLAFAKQYPDEVAGIVLLDPTHPEHWQTMQSEVPMMAAIVLIASARFTPAMRREFDDQARCNAKLGALPMPAVPAELLVRGEFRGIEAGAFEAAVRRLEGDWVDWLGVDAARRIQGSGHYIQKDRPAVVVDAIMAVARPHR